MKNTILDNMLKATMIRKGVLLDRSAYVYSGKCKRAMSCMNSPRKSAYATGNDIRAYFRNKS